MGFISEGQIRVVIYIGDVVSIVLSRVATFQPWDDLSDGKICDVCIVLLVELWSFDRELFDSHDTFITLNVLIRNNDDIRTS